MIFRVARKLRRIYQQYQVAEYAKCMEKYKISAPKEQIDRVHPKVVRYARNNDAKGNDNLVNELFFISFFVKAQKEKDEAAYNKWIHDFAELSFNGGKRYHEPVTTWKHKTQKLAFLGLGDDPSAYIHIYHLCEYLKKSGQYEPYLFLFSGADNLQRITAEFQQVDTPVSRVPFNESNIVDSSKQMREALAKEEIDTVVWVHLPTLMFFLYGMQVAKHQIFLSQYLHPDIASLGIDGLLTYGSIAEKESVFLKDPWRVMPSALDMPVKTGGDSQALRRQFARDDQLVLATFGRIEKIRQKDFLNAVAEILRQTPQAVYLYTGYENDERITEFFAGKNLADRVRFIGWVDIDAYVSIVDLVLDSFPLATGITALKAMAYGRPVLSIGDAYSYMGRDIKPVVQQDMFDGFAVAEPTFAALKKTLSTLAFQPYAVNEKDYVVKAVALANNEQERAKFADFQRSCVNHLYLNKDLMGEVFVEHIRGITSKD